MKIPESLFNGILNEDPSLKNKFDKIVLRNFTENNVDIRWCPNPNDCGRCVRTDMHYNKEITCDCGYVYCFTCLREGHRYKNKNKKIIFLHNLISILDLVCAIWYNLGKKRTAMKEKM